MKHHMARIAAFLILISLALSGCSGDPSTKGSASDVPDPYAAAIIVGRHCNSMDISPDAIGDLLSDLASCRGSVILISCEGDPRIIYNGPVLQEEINEGWSDSKKQTHYSAAAAEMLKLCSSITSKTPGNDTLGAIHLAADALAAYEEYTRVLIILDTGLSTAAPMDCRAGLLNASPEQVLDDIKAAHALPSLKNVVGTWYGLSAVAAPQEELNYEDQENLMSIYDTLLDAAGADISFSSQPFTEVLEGDFPEVPLVNVREESQEVYPLPWESEDGLQIGEDSIYFVPDTAEFRDKDAAIEALSPIAEALISHPEAAILIAGCTASLPSKEDWCQELSQMRAKACKDLLTDLMGSSGADAGDRIVTIGLGSNDPWHEDDLDASGHQTAVAARNRRIVILDLYSEKAQALLTEASH